MTCQAEFIQWLPFKENAKFSLDLTKTFFNPRRFKIGMLNFRHGGLYRLPDRRVYVVYNFGDDHYLFYPCETGPSMPPAYEVRATGEIKRWPGEHHTGWHAANLEDTGETYNFPEGFRCPE